MHKKEDIREAFEPPPSRRNTFRKNLIQLTLAIGMGLVGAPGALAQGSANLLSNGDFENRLRDYQVFSGNAYISRSSYQGKYALRAGDRANWTWVQRSIDTSKLVAGKTYTLRAMGRVAGSVPLSVGIKNDNHIVEIDFSGSNYSANSANFVVPAGMNWAVLYIAMPNTSGSGLIDNIAIVEAGAAAPVIQPEVPVEEPLAPILVPEAPVEGVNNLISNGDFESGMDGYETHSGSPSISGSSYSGSQALKAGASGDWTWVQKSIDTSNLVAGRTYTLQAVGRISGSIPIALGIKNDNHIAEVQFRDSNYTARSVSFVAPAGLNWAVVYIAMAGTPSSGYLDNIALYEGSVLVPGEDPVESSPETPTPDEPLPVPPSSGNGSAEHGGTLSRWTAPTGNAGIDRARAWVAAQSGMRVNIEREGAFWGLGDFGSGTQSYTALRNSGVIGVRLFFPWKYTGFSHPAYTMPSASELDAQIGQSMTNALRAGLTVHVAMMDVIYEADTVKAQDGGKMTKEFVARFSEVLAGRAVRDNWDMSKVLITPVNEWAGGSNATYNQFRIDLHNIVRSKLGPNAILGLSPSYWGDPSHLNNELQLPADSGPYVVELHHYPSVANGKRASYWADMQARVLAWSDARGGVPVVLGEAAASDAVNHDGQAANPWAFPEMIQALAEGAPELRPALWTVTKSGWFRLNKSSSDPAIMDGSNGQPDLVGIIKEATATIRNKADSPN